MISKEFATRFTKEWIDAYDESIDFTSPFIVQLHNDPTGRILNKKDLREYFSRALIKYPDLHFQLFDTFLSVNSLVIHYESVNNMIAAEYFEFDDHGKITRVKAHYANNP